ncbi:hypothetical protein G7Y79_00029g063290 [Physcia stellaris]|nr:hypothetical protein G7Y79_00029g063290 [Physcia stellaris]
MASLGGSRRYSNSRVSSVRESEVPDRAFRRKRPSDERDHRKSRDYGTEVVERVYVLRHVDGQKKQRDDPREHRLRRSSDTVARHKVDSERRRLEEVEVTRRESRRGYSSHKEEGVRRRADPRRDSISSTYHDRPLPRSSSVREKSASRPPLERSQSSMHKTRPQSIVSTNPLPQPSKQLPPSPFRRKPDRPSSIFNSIFKSPPQPPPPPQKPLPPEKLVECLTCLSDVPATRTAKLACQHRMCHSCLRRIFTLSVTDPQHMPPKCCTADHIPLKHVDRLFDLKFKKTWNKKYQEYTTKNRIYCPARGCGEWIKPAHIHVDTSGGANGGRKYGKCTRCRTKVCCTCNGRWHTGKECPKDEATARFAEIAKKEGWQRCFNCSATVELREGCNHMTCRCRAEFCMICGAKWKSCDCPWFNYEAVENDRLNHMRVPQDIPVPQQGRNPALGYQEELERRREQERADEALARRIQVLGLDGIDERPFPPAPRQPPPPQREREREAINVHEYLVHPAPHLAPDFIRRAQDILAAAYNPAQQDHRANNLLNPPHQHHPPPANTHNQTQPRPHRPPPPQASAPEPAPILRQHSAASRAYNTHAATRASERVVPRRVEGGNAMEAEAEAHRPRPRARARIVCSRGWRGGLGSGGLMLGGGLLRFEGLDWVALGKGIVNGGRKGGDGGLWGRGRGGEE